MIKENVIDFASKQKKAVRDEDTGKTVIKNCDVSKWFENDVIIEFDDSLECSENVASNASLSQMFGAYKLNLINPDGSKIPLKKLPTHCARELSNVLLGFFRAEAV